MTVELIAYTQIPGKTGNPMAVVEQAASVCYDSHPTENYRIAKTCKASGHTSVLEHISFTFHVSGVSRALLAQLTRHRIASFSVQSQRYVSMADGFDYVVPPSISALGEDAEAEFARQMDQMHAWYCQWQEKLGGAGESANQDARFVLPNAAATRLLVTMNARELLHFFELRCCNRAQWEIREMAWQMLACCREAAPALFAHAGPACVSGPCPEGKNTCGKASEVREKCKNL